MPEPCGTGGQHPHLAFSAVKTGPQHAPLMFRVKVGFHIDERAHGAVQEGVLHVVKEEDD